MQIRYFVEVTGDRPPYKWQLRRQIDGRKSEALTAASEVGSEEEAYALASEAAREFEDARRHRETHHEVLVLEVDDRDARPACVPPETLNAFERALVQP